MKDSNVQEGLEKAANRFKNVKKTEPADLLESIVGLMEPIGGITGITVRSNMAPSIHNHSASYNLPIKFEEHSGRLSSFGKKAYAFLDLMMDHLECIGVSPRNIECHLGKRYSTKHHNWRR